MCEPTPECDSVKGTPGNCAVKGGGAAASLVTLAGRRRPTRTSLPWSSRHWAYENRCLCCVTGAAPEDTAKHHGPPGYSALLLTLFLARLQPVPEALSLPQRPREQAERGGAKTQVPGNLL